MKHYFIILFCLLSLKSSAHGGEDHGEGKKPQTQTGKNYFTVNSVSDVFEMVLRYKPIDAGHGTAMTLFVSDFETNQAVDSAKIEITCPEDDKLKFAVEQSDKGTYKIGGTFPENKSYTLIANISAGEKADLMTFEGIDVGKKLPVAEEEHAHSVFDWKNILYISLAFISGIFLTFFILRKKQLSKKAMSIVLILLTLSTSLNSPKIAFAHEGHGDEQKKETKNTLTDEVEILKETQFLFDMQTIPSIYNDYYSTLKLYGKVMPSVNGSAQIIAPQNGSIVSLNVGIGDKVGKGQILAVIEQTLSAPEQVQLSTEKSGAEAEYETAKKELDRLKSIQDIIARKDLLQAEIRFKTAEANLKIYQNLSANNSKLLTIKSPLDGVVDNFNLSIGQQVMQNEQLFTVYDTRKVKIEAQIFNRDMDKVKGEVEFFMEDVKESNKTEKAKLISINKAVNPVNQSSLLILEVENPDGDFRPGQFVNVNVMAKSEKKQLVVPSSAVSDINGKPVVFVHTTPEIFKVKYIQPGESNSETTIVLKGLDENERVVRNGTYQVKSIFLNQ